MATKSTDKAILTELRSITKDKTNWKTAIADVQSARQRKHWRGLLAAIERVRELCLSFGEHNSMIIVINTPQWRKDNGSKIQ